MAHHPQPDPDPVPIQEPPSKPAEPLKIETPIIDVQDLEHQVESSRAESAKAGRIEPTLDSDDMRDLFKEDQAAIDALEKFEKSLARMPPD